MRGSNITNKYILDSKEYLLSDLTREQLAHVESLADKTKYNNLMNQVLEEKEDDVECTIKINVVDQEMTAYGKFGMQLYKIT